jgi:type VI secretion system protein ImpM
MSRALTPANVGYFGKLPSRGDFVKGSTSPGLVKVLDGWLAEAMDLMSANARWKLAYDAVAPLHFAFVAPRQRHAIGGHIVASSDESSRRYPFLMVCAMEVAEPAAFVPKSPLVFTRLWRRLDGLTADVRVAADPTLALQAAAAQPIELDLRAGAYDAAFEDFLELQTVAGLDAMLAQTGFRGSARQVLLALGMLLQPVLASGSSRLEKSLVLPLPDDPVYRNLVAAFWMHLVTPFLARADFELALLLTRLEGRHVLVVGFSGASARTLCSIMDPQAAPDHRIGFEELDWVEDLVDSDYAIKKISAYLAQGDLSLKSALESVGTAFIGT